MPNSDPIQPETAKLIAQRELNRFRQVQHLHNHWARSFRSSYYWYLTFEHQPNVLELVRACQQAVDFPYYDAVNPKDLHMTLQRVAHHGEISSAQLDLVVEAGTHVCAQIEPIEFKVGGLGGSAGAIGLSAWPLGPIKRLRDALYDATAAAFPHASPQRGTFNAHVAIAYCNEDGSPAAVTRAIEEFDATRCITVEIRRAALVKLERESHSYSWTRIAHVSLASRESEG